MSDPAASQPVVLQVGPYPDWDQAPLDAAYQMKRLYDAPDPKAYLAEIGPEVRAIATRGNLSVPEEMIAACPTLELITVYGVGYDGVDIDACRARGIHVTNTPDVLTQDVADFGVAMMLAQWRRIVPGEAWVRSGDWAARGGLPLGRRVFGSKAGILGLGRIGRAVAQRLAAFEMQIAYTDIAPVADAPYPFVAAARDLAAQVDILFVTLSASAATRHIVGADVLAALGPAGLLVNISRASTVDEAALLNALASGVLGGAALDVFEGEPRIDPRWRDLPNVLLQPHQASATEETRRDMGRLMRDNLAAHFSGQPLLTPVL